MVAYVGVLLKGVGMKLLLSTIVGAVVGIRGISGWLIDIAKLRCCRSRLPKGLARTAEVSIGGVALIVRLAGLQAFMLLRTRGGASQRDNRLFTFPRNASVRANIGLSVLSSAHVSMFLGCGSLSGTVS